MILNKLRMNKDLISVLVNRVWNVVKGPFTTLFQILFLTPSQQGMWYSFTSIGALSSLAELGFTTIITQFISHEYVYVELLDEEIVASSEHKDKIVSLIRYAIKFYTIIVLLLILILSIVGINFFYNESIFVRFSWIIYSISGGISLYVSLFQAIYCGFNKIYETQRNIFVGSIIVTILNWMLLFLGLNVLTLGLCSIISSFIMAFLLYYENPFLWKFVFYHKVSKKYNWKNEILTLQGKYAISFISGYFIFNIFSPMIYKIDGAEISGQFGMTALIISSICNFAYSIADSKIPLLNMMAERKEYVKLWDMINKIIKTSIILCGFIMILFYIFIYIIQPFEIFSSRFIAPNLLLFIIVMQYVNFILGVTAKCLRIFKNEPFMLISVFIAVFTIIIIYLFYPRIGLLYSLSILSICYLFVVPIIYRIKFKTISKINKREI